MEKIKAIIKKLVNRETVTYLVFGVLTTVVNFGVFKAFDLVFTKVTEFDLTLLTNFIAWVVSVVFAFVTNKLFVFESKSWKGSVLRKEIPSFVGARVFSLGVEELGLLIFVKWLGFGSFVWEIIPGFALGGKMLTKIGLAVIVVVMNYIFSKFIIFKNKEKE
ncbi:MAG: GtrA family protein [Clostridia bacterium]|nr:GtrA family protein [Clostridia bacterium]